MEKLSPEITSETPGWYLIQNPGKENDHCTVYVIDMFRVLERKCGSSYLHPIPGENLRGD